MRDYYTIKETVYRLRDPEKFNLDPLKTYNATIWKDGYRIITVDNEYIEFAKDAVENNSSIFEELTLYSIFSRDDKKYPDNFQLGDILD